MNANQPSERKQTTGDPSAEQVANVLAAWREYRLLTNAAPDMLDALKDLLDLVDTAVGAGLLKHSKGSINHCRVEAARAAIAKAEGK